MTTLYITSLVCLAVLAVPGTLCLRAAGMPLAWAFSCSPLIGLAMLAVIGQVLALVGVASSPLLIFGLEALLVAVVFAARRLLKLGDMKMPEMPLWMPVVYLVVGAALGYNLFISRLASADALFQAYDVTQHLNLIKSMVDSGRFTSLGVSPYMSAADAAIAPVDYSGFYPAAWHALCALVIMICGVQTTVAINASMFVISSLAFPLAMLAFISAIFPGNKKAQLIGAVVNLAFVSFPWNLLVFGPVYANVAGYCLLPAACAIFISLFSDGHEPHELVLLAIALAGGAIGLALCHPSAIFTCIVLLSPYCVARIWEASGEKGAKPPVRIGLCAAFLAFVAAFWVVCYKLPAFHDTVSHTWKPYAWSFQELVNILLCVPTFGFSEEEGAQYVLGAIVVFGFVKCLFTPKKRWASVSYLLACAIMLAVATREDELKQLVGGFWYTDPMRVASMCSIAAVPLAAVGFEWLHGLVCRLLDRYNAPLGHATRTRVAGCVLAALFVVVNFMPSFNLAGTHRKYTDEEYRLYGSWEDRDRPIKSLSTTYGDYRKIASEVYTKTAPLDPTERVFISKVLGIVGSDDLIINDPMDGSFLTYGVYNMRVYYRNFTGIEGDSDTETSRVLRLHLCEYATNDVVKQAVEEVDARYVLVMRGTGSEAGFINLRGDYDQSLFVGITSITGDTPGFKQLLKTGSMALYEIER